MYSLLIYLLVICTKVCSSYRHNHRSSNNPLKYHLITQQDDYILTTQRPFLSQPDHKLRHVSRYKKLDGLIDRMNHFDLDIPTTKKYAFNWNKHPTTIDYNSFFRKSDDRLKKVIKKKERVILPHGGASFDEYDDSTDDSDMESDPNEYGDVTETDNEDEEDNGTDDDHGNDENSWQAEDSNREIPKVTAFTDEKWQFYGTRERVEKTRDNYLKGGGTSQQLRHEAGMHLKRMMSEASCKVPRAKVVSVQSVHPDITRTYLPSCTILHRCGEDTGCCDQGVCSPKSQKPVELYFHIVDSSDKLLIKSLIFDNHTECHCKVQNYRSDSFLSGEIIADGTSKRDISDTTTLSDVASPESMFKCKCPADFSHVINIDYCRCVCKTDKCHLRNIGKEHFSLDDRLCIQRNECKTPSCHYGSYISKDGLCPKKEDKLNDFAGFSHKILPTRRKRLYRSF